MADNRGQALSAPDPLGLALGLALGPEEGFPLGGEARERDPGRSLTFTHVTKIEDDCLFS